jgi:hypothetical protein
MWQLAVSASKHLLERSNCVADVAGTLAWHFAVGSNGYCDGFASSPCARLDALVWTARQLQGISIRALNAAVYDVQ